MTWIAQRSRRRKALECFRAARFAHAQGSPTTDPRRLRKAWLYGRFNLLPRDFDLRSGPILDVGANAGDWTAALLCLAPQADVLAFEPSPAIASALRERFAHESRVRVIAKAVSDSVGEVVLHVTANSHNNSMLVPRDMNREYRVSTGWEETEAIAVASITLDALLPEIGAPSLVKIDVQGAEPLVLAGAADTLASAKAVFLEMTERSHYEGDVLGDNLDRRMRQLGYRMVGTSDPWLAPGSGLPLWYDACFLNTRFFP